ncbi:hypothetical protein [Roseobacter sp. CCS2]|uniref:hypothetical protein n=1 Tax=Roseobacter sp. CCS2 TaxID=391593 RepID=UPI0000F3E3B0|nr:hypothetical protein [Roseobacter sp. CCS2]EBA11995.1 hypothetical protein RCCS2_11899 [Roseobacter sp. CCS2]
MYDSAVGMLTRKTYESKKKRWMIPNSPRFSSDEFRDYMALAVENGLVDAGRNNDALRRGELDGDEWLLKLTLAGWNYIEDFDQPVLERWFVNIRDNVPTIIVSVATALIIANANRLLDLIVGTVTP